jgi:hypothetical protein
MHGATIKINTQLIDKLSHSYSCVPVLSVISFDFAAEVFWRHLFGFTYSFLKQMPAFVFSNCSLVFVYLLEIFACWDSIILIPASFNILYNDQQIHN